MFGDDNPDLLNWSFQTFHHTIKYLDQTRIKWPCTIFRIWGSSAALRDYGRWSVKFCWWHLMTYLNFWQNVCLVSRSSHGFRWAQPSFIPFHTSYNCSAWSCAKVMIKSPISTALSSTRNSFVGNAKIGMVDGWFTHHFWDDHPRMGLTHP